MIAAGGCYAAAQWWPAALLLVNALLAVNWFGDGMDGTLARFRNKQRPRYGYYVDHIVDAFSAVSLFGGLALSGLTSPPVAVGMLLCYLLLAIQSYLATHSLGVFSISWWKFSPTEMRILLAMGNTVVYFQPVIAPAGWHILFFDLARVISIVCMLGVLAASVVPNTILLYRIAIPRRACLMCRYRKFHAGRGPLRIPFEIIAMFSMRGTLLVADDEAAMPGSAPGARRGGAAVSACPPRQSLRDRCRGRSRAACVTGTAQATGRERQSLQEKIRQPGIVRDF